MAKNLKSMVIRPLTQSIYLKPMEIRYKMKGVQKKWDYIEVHNSVAVIIFNNTRKVFVCVKQFRPSVYVNHIPQEERLGCINIDKYPIESGIPLEFCAGKTDKNLTYEETAKAEVLEETGYNIPVEKLEKVRTYWSSVSNSPSEMHMYYVEVEDHMKIGKGGGLKEEGEFIEVVEISFNEAKKIWESSLVDNNYVGLLFGFLWFFHIKAPLLKLDESR